MINTITTITSLASSPPYECVPLPTQKGTG